MKKIGLIMLPLLLAACGDVSPLGSRVQPYNIQLSSLGYEARIEEEQLTFVVAGVTGQVVSTAGAPDVLKITYSAELVDAVGKTVVENDNSIIAPLKGTLIAGVKGGYVCTGDTPPSSCTMASPDAQLVMTDSAVWPQNSISRSFIPGEWAAAHYYATQGGDTSWSVNFTFTAEQANGKITSWKQNYQFLRPVRSE